MSHVAVSFETPEYTANADGIGTLRILEAIRILGLEKKARFYQDSTSELYGLLQETPQKEAAPFYPRSPYAVAKLRGDASYVVWGSGKPMREFLYVDDMADACVFLMTSTMACLMLARVKM